MNILRVLKEQVMKWAGIIKISVLLKNGKMRYIDSFYFWNYFVHFFPWIGKILTLILKLKSQFYQHFVCIFLKWNIWNNRSIESIFSQFVDIFLKLNINFFQENILRQKKAEEDERLKAEEDERQRKEADDRTRRNEEQQRQQQQHQEDERIRQQEARWWIVIWHLMKIGLYRYFAFGAYAECFY